MRGLLDSLLEIRLADAVDILLVTFLVYAGIVWIRRTQAGLVAGGIVILAALYIIATSVGLQLTAWLLQGFFAIFLIIVVIIFQEELRQLFERLALFSLRRNKRIKTPANLPDILVEAAADLARDRIGALIVLQGEQPLRRHVRGGIELGAKLSVPLIKSVFDPHSPGHDGAMILEGDRIALFAAHLPLSTDFQQLAGVGTRHSAALGLAELTDALCLVVSEERGRISVAKDGKLRALRDANELARVLAAEQAAREPTRDWRTVLRQLLFSNWVERLASLAVVLGLWLLFVPGSRPAEMILRMPIEVVNLPVGATVESIEPTEVQATFTGPRRAFALLNSRDLAVTVDAGRVKPGQRTFAISEENLRHPPSLTVQNLQPRRVKVALTEAPTVPEPAPTLSSGGKAAASGGGR
jgi:diadenylate cyclase